MNLSPIPTDVLRAEHGVMDEIRYPWQFRFRTPVCAYMHAIGQECDSCMAIEDCELLLDGSTGWSERKERYLLAIRAELANRGSPLSQPSEEVVD